MNLRPLAAPLVALALCWIGFIAFVLATGSRLPERTATHFGANGVPNGWMMRSTHVKAMLALGPGISGFLLLTFFGIRFLGGWGLNIPHRDYWLAPGRREATFDFVALWGCWLACVEVAFMAGVHWVIVLANERSPASLPVAPFAWITGGFLAMVAAWSVALIVRFRAVPKA